MVKLRKQLPFKIDTRSIIRQYISTINKELHEFNIFTLTINTTSFNSTNSCQRSKNLLTNTVNSHQGANDIELQHSSVIADMYVLSCKIICIDKNGNPTTYCAACLKMEC